MANMCTTSSTSPTGLATTTVSIESIEPASYSSVMDEDAESYDYFCGPMTTDEAILARINRVLSGFSAEQPSDSRSSSTTSEMPVNVSKTYSSPMKDIRKLDTPNPEEIPVNQIPNQQQDGAIAGTPRSSSGASSKRPGGRLSTRRPSQQWEEKVVDQFTPTRRSGSKSRQLSATTLANAASNTPGKQKSGSSIWNFQDRQSRTSMSNIASASGARRSVGQSNALPVSSKQAASAVISAENIQPARDLVVFSDQQQQEDAKDAPASAKVLSTTVVENGNVQLAPSAAITLKSKTSRSHINIPQEEDVDLADKPHNPVSPGDVMSAEAIQAVPAAAQHKSRQSGSKTRRRSGSGKRRSSSNRRSSNNKHQQHSNTNVGRKRLSGIFANTHDGGVWRSTRTEDIVNDPDVWSQAIRDSERSRVWKRRPAEIRYSTRENRTSEMREAFTGNLGKTLQNQKSKIVTAVQTSAKKVDEKTTAAVAQAEEQTQALGSKVLARTSEGMKVLSGKAADAQVAAKEEAKKAKTPNLRGASMIRRRSSTVNRGGKPSWWYWTRRSTLPKLPRPGAGESAKSPAVHQSPGNELITSLTKKPHKKRTQKLLNKQHHNTGSNFRAGSSVGSRRRTRAASRLAAAIGLHPSQVPWQSISQLSRPLSLTDFIPDREGIRAALFGEDEMGSGESYDSRSHAQGDARDDEASSSSNWETVREERENSKGRRDALGLTPSQNFPVHQPIHHGQLRMEPLGSSLMSSSSSGHGKGQQERNPRAAAATKKEINPRAAGRKRDNPSVTFMGSRRSRPLSVNAMNRQVVNQQGLVNRKAPPVLVFHNQPNGGAGMNTGNAACEEKAAEDSEVAIPQPAVNHPMILGSSKPPTSVDNHRPSTTFDSQKSIHTSSGELLPPREIRDASLVVIDDEIDVASDATVTHHTLSRDPFQAYCCDDDAPHTVSAAVGSSRGADESKTLAPHMFNIAAFDEEEEDAAVLMPADELASQQEVPDEVAVPTPSNDDEEAAGNADGAGDRDLLREENSRSEGGFDDDDTCSRYQGGSNDGGCPGKKDPYARAHLAFERAKALFKKLMSLRNEVIYLKEDIVELNIYHECCGLDEIMYARVQSKEKTAFPRGPPECFENSNYGFGIMAYKTFLDKWAVEYINEMIERRKGDKVKAILNGREMQLKLREMLHHNPAVFQAKEFKNDVSAGGYKMAKILENVEDIELVLPRILKTVQKVVCSWNKQKNLQLAVQQLEEYFRIAPTDDSAVIHMFEVLYPNDPFDVLRFMFTKQNGTDIEETTLGPSKAFTPRVGRAVNWCEAKKLLHFMQYRHLHPQHKWPKKNKGGNGRFLRGGAAGIGQLPSEDLIDENDELELMEKVRLFDLEGIALKRKNEVELGTITMKREYQRLARTIAYKIRDTETCIRELMITLATCQAKPQKPKDIFSDAIVHQDMSFATMEAPITIEKYGFPIERTTFEDFIRR